MSTGAFLVLPSKVQPYYWHSIDPVNLKIGDKIHCLEAEEGFERETGMKPDMSKPLVYTVMRIDYVISEYDLNKAYILSEPELFDINNLPQDGEQ